MLTGSSWPRIMAMLSSICCSVIPASSRGRSISVRNSSSSKSTIRRTFSLNTRSVRIRMSSEKPWATPRTAIRSNSASSSMDEPIREDDAELLRIAVRGVAQGFSDDILIRTLRVFSENVRRIVDFELELFRTEIERPLLEAGMTEQQMLDNMAMMRGQLEPVSIRLAYLLHRRHEEHAFFQDATEHIENALTKAGMAERRVARPPAIAFL